MFATISFWMVGFGAGRGCGNYMLYMVTLVLTDVVAESYILVCGSITTDNKVATVIAPVLLCFFMLFSGFLVNSGKLGMLVVCAGAPELFKIDINHDHPCAVSIA